MTVLSLCLGLAVLTSQGCFHDNPADRDLSHRGVFSGLTPTMCLSHCKDYKYAALQVSRPPK